MYFEKYVNSKKQNRKKGTVIIFGFEERITNSFSMPKVESKRQKAKKRKSREKKAEKQKLEKRTVPISRIHKEGKH